MILIAKQKYIIDTFKFLTIFVQLYFCYLNPENTTQWVYTALHGTYGILWVIKSMTFGDKTWEEPGHFWKSLYVLSGFILFWSPGWLIYVNNVHAPNRLLFLCISMYTFGVFLHFASDMQKTLELSLKKGLITTRLWSWTRNPNYLGELMIYSGFNLLAMHWFPFLVLIVGIVTIWVPNMLNKDKSLSRYPEFREYEKRTYMWIPFVW
jgi:protein-S-isoprenylcysteine O-methyltransferase Ste14